MADHERKVAGTNRGPKERPLSVGLTRVLGRGIDRWWLALLTRCVGQCRRWSPVVCLGLGPKFLRNRGSGALDDMKRREKEQSVRVRRVWLRKRSWASCEARLRVGAWSMPNHLAPVR